MTERPYGKIAGLPVRIADWVGRMNRDRSLPWAGLGILDDLEVVVRLLSLEEFGQWLRQHSDDELQRWGAEVLDAAADREHLEGLMADIEEHLPDDGTNAPHGEVVQQAGAAIDATRTVLVELGALSADDTTTDVPALLRALLA